MKIIDIPGGQGSDAWHHFRLEHFGASEAAAMLGLSKLVKRNELLAAKKTGIAREFSEWVQKHILDKGHEVEALARPIVERDIVQDDLYPITCAKGRISASCDGLTLEGAIAFEHKQWNEELAESVRSGNVPDEHMPQCQQVLMVTGAARLAFVVSDGTAERMVHAWVEPDAAWFDRLERGWEQFAKDLEGFEPQAPAAVVTAAPLEALPAPSGAVKGALAVVTNLDRFGLALRAFVDRIPKQPSTDQEFVDVDAACKKLKECEERLQAAEDSALASLSDVETMRTSVATLRELARTTRLASEKVVAARKQQIREEEVRRGRDAFGEHFRSLTARLGGPYMPPVPTDFAGAIKGLKTLDSVRNAIDTELARAKIEANALADKIDANLKTIDAAGAPTLFPDLGALALKAPDDLAAVIAQRLAAEHKRQDDERERIRAEEQARAAAPNAAASTPPAPQTVTMPAAAPAQRADLLAPAVIDARPDIKLGDLNGRLGFTMNAAFVVETLGVATVPDPKGRAVLFKAADLPRIRAALLDHIGKALA